MSTTTQFMIADIRDMSLFGIPFIVVFAIWLIGLWIQHNYRSSKKESEEREKQIRGDTQESIEYEKKLDKKERMISQEEQQKEQKKKQQERMNQLRVREKELKDRENRLKDHKSSKPPPPF